VETVLTERRGAVLIVTLNRPDRLNAWTDEMEDRYFDVLAFADSDGDVRAIVVTGAGRGFCGGADFADLEQLRDPAGAEPQPRPRPRTYPLSIRKPVIAAVNGAAAGLGLVEALYCDVRFATPQAKLTTAFARRGLIAEYGIAWLLPRIVGTGRALDLLLSGRVINGQEAHAIGLVDHLVEPENLVDAAVDYAAELASSCSPTSMSVIKRQVLDAWGSDFTTAVDDADRLMLASFRYPDAAEGVASYLQKRPPSFLPLPTP
jgi:enoyl-CoA hydratase/carnithine racemase